MDLLEYKRRQAQIRKSKDRGANYYRILGDELTEIYPFAKVGWYVNVFDIRNKRCATSRQLIDSVSLLTTRGVHLLVNGKEYSSEEYMFWMP